MEKTYKVLENTKPMLADEIRTLYRGHWVYIVNAQLTDSKSLISGTPVVIGDMAYDGADDGIYEKYNGDEYIERVGLSLLPNRGFISSLVFANEARG
ncbi:MAG: hypothetical protein LBI54_10150 [Lachnospiraceae bacterium]|jgi:hypothetical protein|nr:hypothetical protein [Lachnospiraceae bacterium]